MITKALAFLWLLYLLHFTDLTSGSSTTKLGHQIQSDLGTGMKDSAEQQTIEVLFSDVDGTLVHYPGALEDYVGKDGIISLPPSSTGMQGIISTGTLQKFEKLRSFGTKIVIVSGMRTSTLLKRIPYLPKADAYCSEAGGRIFYPCDVSEGTLQFETHQCDGVDTTTFSLIEDLEWRAKMELISGKKSYVGNDLTRNQEFVPVSERDGPLWAYCSELQKKSFVVDTNGYSSCFRVNLNQQTAVSKEDFTSLLNSKPPTGLATSVNLGNIDFYPETSGKKNCCEYLAAKLCGKTASVAMKNTVCMCDDDNDLEMALACGHAFVPGISSESMEEVVKANPSQITVTGGPNEGREGTDATEWALDLIVAKIEGLS